MGGVGKTQLALKYAYRSKGIYKYTCWVRAEDDTSLADSFLNLGRRVGVLRGSSREVNDDIRLVRNWLTTSKW